MRIQEPGVLIEREIQRARIQEQVVGLDASVTVAKHALELSHTYAAKSQEERLHKALRDLAQKQNDFAGYIEHNNEYLRITEEIRGQEATKKLTMLEAEKRIAAERAEKEKHKALLYNTLPPAIADRVLRGETVNDSHDMAAVMFMDMVGFTTMSSTMEAGEVVKLLSEIFTTCDAIMAEHGMMKIKTIGDSYMAVAIESNTEDQKPKTTQTVNSAAKAAVQLLKTLSEQHPEIRVRIGLHCGPVTAGVIGTERLQYDVWGDTVNVASRMESHGEPGRIHVSEAFASRVTHRHPREGGDSLTPDTLTLSKRGVVSIKGKGPMTTYWLEGA
jgi:class 3 adenylate cyclase